MDRSDLTRKIIEWSTRMPKTINRSSWTSQNYTAINPDARNYGEKYLDIENYEKIGLNSKNYRALDPVA